MTTQSIWKIPSSVDTLSMDLEHCNLQFIAPDDDDNAVEPMLTIQHWNFLGGSSVVHRGSTTHVALHMSMLNPMFRFGRHRAIRVACWSGFLVLGRPPTTDKDHAPESCLHLRV